MMHSGRGWTVAVWCILALGCGDETGSTPDPAELIKLAGDGQSGLANTALPESIVVRVLDADGAGLPGVTISWAEVTGGGTFAAAALRSDGAGRLAGSWVLGAAGPQVLVASAGGLTVTFNATATSGP